METLRLAITDRSDSDILDAFYEGYDQAFVLPDEKEPIEGFRNCLDLNHPPAYGRLSSRVGAYREIVFTATDIASGAQVGGGNLIVLSHTPPSAAVQLGYRTIHLNYVYVLPTQRRRGHLGRLLSMIDRIASDALPQTAGATSYIFIEQNDPLKMSADAYAEDTRQTGLDQVERISLWARQGARIVDVDYVQPALSPEHVPDRSLTLCVLRPELAALDACVVGNHLRAFFEISVLKGADPYQDPVASGQIVALDHRCAANEKLRLLDPTFWATGEGRKLRDGSDRIALPGGLRTILASAAPTDQ